jgi:hypothetical protein
MLVMLSADRRMPRRRPGALAGGDEQQAALIQKGQMGPKSSGSF